MRVLLVEDSATVTAYVREICSRSEEIEFLEPARDGREGVARALAERPDVILMDLNLPELDGVSAITEILTQAPIPIVVLSAYLDEARTFEALQAGAVEVLSKPRGMAEETLNRFERQLLRTLRVMKEARVIKRRASDKHGVPAFEVVLFGASTGGPQVLYRILDDLQPLPVPIVIVQHTCASFEEGLATWLSTAGHDVIVAQKGALEAGRVYIAPAGGHLVLEERGFLTVVPRAPDDLNPSVDRLFKSASETYGRQAVAILLTGMGLDGAAGLLALRNRGALTVTQLGESCVVDGMPAAARALNASAQELDPPAITSLLTRLFRKRTP